MKQIEDISMFLCLVIVILSVAFGTYFVKRSMPLAEEKQKAKEEYIRKNCKVVGYYGRSGEYKTYDCMGVLRKENDF